MKYKKTIIVIAIIPILFGLLIWYTFTNATVYDENTKDHKKEFERFVKENKTRDKIKCFLTNDFCTINYGKLDKKVMWLLNIRASICEYYKHYTMTEFTQSCAYDPCDPEIVWCM